MKLSEKDLSRNRKEIFTKTVGERTRTEWNKNGDNKSSGRCPELFIMGYKRMKFKNASAFLLRGARHAIISTFF